MDSEDQESAVQVESRKTHLTNGFKSGSSAIFRSRIANGRAALAEIFWTSKWIGIMRSGSPPIHFWTHRQNFRNALRHSVSDLQPDTMSRPVLKTRHVHFGSRILMTQGANRFGLYSTLVHCRPILFKSNLVPKLAEATTFLKHTTNENLVIGSSQICNLKKYYADCQLSFIMAHLQNARLDCRSRKLMKEWWRPT